MWEVVSIAHEQAEFVELETFKGIEYNINELRIDIFEFGDFGAVIYDILILLRFGHSDEGLVPLELSKEFLHRLVNNRNDSHDFSHYLILNNNVSLRFYDADAWVVVLFLVYDRVLCIGLGLDFRQSTLQPWVFRVSHRPDAFDIRLQFGWILGIIFTML